MTDDEMLRVAVTAAGLTNPTAWAFIVKAASDDGERAPYGPDIKTRLWSLVKVERARVRNAPRTSGVTP